MTIDLFPTGGGGYLVATKLLGRRPTPAWILDLHRFLGGAAVVLTGVHLVAILVDSYVHFDLVAILVPFASDWNPIAVAWGIAALYLLAAVEITSLLRRSLPNRLWRREAPVAGRQGWPRAGRLRRSRRRRGPRPGTGNSG